MQTLRLALTVLVLTALGFGQDPVRFGIVLDGPSELNTRVVEVFQEEIKTVLEGEFESRFSPAKIVTSDWTAAGVRAVVDRLLSDPEVDQLLALGALGSLEVARRGPLPKPAFAPMVFQPELQGVPIETRQLALLDPGDFETIQVSGVQNLNYLAVGTDLLRDIESFRQIVSFRRLTIIVLGAWRELGVDPESLFRQALAATNLSEIRIVPVGSSIEQALSEISDDAEAVYVTPLPRLNRAAFDQLVQGLIARRLPSFSSSGKIEVVAGILATVGPADETRRRARRVALNIQRVMLGEKPEELPVSYTRVERMVINMATARAIGVSPRFRILLDAELLNQEVNLGVRTLSLPAVVRESSLVNLDLAAADRTVAAGKQTVREAKSALLPRFDLFGSARQVDGDRASFIIPENQLGVGLSGSQLIYSDQAWAGFGIEKNLQTRRIEERAELRLDVILQGGQAYLNVLGAKTVERIQRANLELTRTNLNLARSRVDIGVAGREEVFRWESQIAANQKSVLDAQAAQNQAVIEVNRVLNRPLEEVFVTVEATLDDPEIVSGFDDLRRYLDNPLGFGVFRDFMAVQAELASPELRQLDAGIRAKQRELTAAKRRFFLPDLTFGANVFGHRDHGIGTGFPFPGLNNWDWTVQVEATYSLFEGTARYARQTRVQEELQELTLRREATGQRVEQRIRSILESTNASFVGIELAQSAAEAGRRNLDLVSDSYAAGVVDILLLLDAQNFALEAELAAANAIYGYLLDLMAVQRAVGRFDYYRSPQERQDFLDELAAFFARTGQPVRP